MILPGVTIGNDVIIGAGSVVTHDIPSGVVAVGNPARVISSIKDYLTKRENQLQIYPCFPEKYTVRKHLTDDMKKNESENERQIWILSLIRIV